MKNPSTSLRDTVLTQLRKRFKDLKPNQVQEAKELKLIAESYDFEL